MTPVSTPTMPPEVLVVVGTRPEAIKLLPVIVALRESSAMTPVVVSTGQHRRLVAEVLALATAGDPDLAVFAGEVTTAGRIELLPFLHEQAISITAHRFGNPDPWSEAVI